MASNKSEGNWCLIESDPGVFTEIIKGFGVSGIECEEIIDLDYMGTVGEPYGLIFLYKWQPESATPSNVVTDEETLQRIFFAQQVISNACATQALLNILFNLGDSMRLGPTLSKLREFCQSFDSHMKGLTISNSEEIRRVHNSFGCNALYELDDRRPSSSDDTYHFVAYVPIGGRLYELDGLQEGPIDHGPLPGKAVSWVEAARPVISGRMQRHAETHFNIMALVADKLETLEHKLRQLQETGDVDEEIPQILCSIQEEKAKHERYRVENIRRRHNYMPFIIELLKILAEEGKLTSLVEKAEEAAINRRKRRADANQRNNNKMDVS